MSDALRNAQCCAPAQTGSPETPLDPSVANNDPLGPTDLLTPQNQISGIYTMAILDFLERRLSADELNDFLARAGETRSVEDLKDLSSWTSFDQFKRLLQGASRSLGSPFQT